MNTTPDKAETALEEFERRFSDGESETEDVLACALRAIYELKSDLENARSAQDARETD